MKALIITLILVSCSIFGYSQITIEENSTVILVEPPRENADAVRTKFRELKSAKVIGQLYNRNREYIIVIPSKDNGVVKKAKKEIQAIFPDAELVTEDVSTVNGWLEEMQNKPGTTNKK